MVLGEVGEQLVKEWLSDKGYSIYSPVAQDRPHWFDIMAHDPLKQNLVCIEVKTKPKMRSYNATGINVKSLREYQSLQEHHSINVLLFFVDTDLKEIYFGSLSELMERSVYSNIEYPNFEIVNNIVLFPLEKMEAIKELSGSEIAEIKSSKLN